jgi:FtsH-binding integral membrane protein
MNIFFKNWFKILAIILLFLSLNDNPYGYYQFLRWAILIIGGYSAYLSYKNSHTGWAWTFIVIAVLFNPIVPFYLSKNIWQFIDVATIIVFLCSIINKK